MVCWHAVLHTPFHEDIAGLVACRLTYAILVYFVAISGCPGARGVSAKCAVGHSHRMMPYRMVPYRSQLALLSLSFFSKGSHRAYACRSMENAAVEGRGALSAQANILSCIYPQNSMRPKPMPFFSN